MFALKRFTFSQKRENCVCSQVFLFYPRYFAFVLKCLHFLEKLRLYATVLRFAEKCVFSYTSFAFLRDTLHSFAKVLRSLKLLCVRLQKFSIPLRNVAFARKSFAFLHLLKVFCSLEILFICFKERKSCASQCFFFFSLYPFRDCSC